MTDPDGSVTTPTIRPVASCAASGTDVKTKATSMATIHNQRVDKNSFVMFSSPEDPNVSPKTEALTTYKSSQQRRSLQSYVYLVYQKYRVESTKNEQLPAYRLAEILLVQPLL